MEQEKRHIDYLDYLRVFSALGVVWMHTAVSGLRAGVTRGWHFMNLATSLAFTAVPLFFMISGFLLLSDDRSLDWKLLLRRRLPRLILPLAAWTAVAAARNCAVARDFSPLYFLGQLRDALYSPILVPFWFMYTLIAVYLLSPLLRAGLRETGEKGAPVILGLIGLVSLRAMLLPFLPAAWQHWLSPDLLRKLQAWGGYLLLFVLGWYLGNWKRRVDERLLLAVALVCYGVIVLGTWRRTVAAGEYDAMFQDQSAGFEVVLAACLFLLAKQRLDRPCRLLRRTGLVPLLLPVYYLHAVILMVFYAFGIDPLRTPAIAGLTLLNFLLCWLIAKTLASLRPLCYVFTGIPYETAKQTCAWGSQKREKKA